MTPEQQLKIIEKIKVHSEIIVELSRQLNVEPVKKGRGLSPEELARRSEMLRQKMYR